MHNRSNHLQEFVESYRKLAMLPSPKKEKTELSDYFNRKLSSNYATSFQKRSN
jgi:two-component system nitrogen regulation sensor histidine kinase NtrY